MENTSKKKGASITNGYIDQGAFRGLVCAHFILSGSIESDDLESLSFSELLFHFPNNLEKNTSFTEFIGLEGLKGCLHRVQRLEKNEWHALVKEVSERAKRLAPFESLLIPGGGKKSARSYWRHRFSLNRPMFYLLSRTEGDTYNFYVLNTGAGLEEFYAKREIDGKTQHLLLPALTPTSQKKSFFIKRIQQGFSSSCSLL